MPYCSTCKLQKTRDSFHKNRSQKNGLNRSCKECRHAQSVSNYKKHKDEILKVVAKNRSDSKLERQNSITEHLNNSSCKSCDSNRNLGYLHNKYKRYKSFSFLKYFGGYNSFNDTEFNHELNTRDTYCESCVLKMEADCIRAKRERKILNRIDCSNTTLLDSVKENIKHIDKISIIVNGSKKYLDNIKDLVSLIKDRSSRYKHLAHKPNFSEPIESLEVFSFKCLYCKDDFNAEPKYVRSLNKRLNNGEFKKNIKFCSKDCANKSHKNDVNIKCQNILCNKYFNRTPTSLRKINFPFCSQSCSATFNNCNKRYGTRVSKLEIFLQDKLKEHYDLDIIFNNKDTIGSELDIYFKDLNIAFEVNGIHHYKPIFGEDKFEAVKLNDEIKKYNCNLQCIQLYVIQNDEVFSKSFGYSCLDEIRMIIDPVC